MQRLWPRSTPGSRPKDSSRPARIQKTAPLGAVIVSAVIVSIVTRPKGLLAAIATEPGPFSQAYFLLTLLLGTRKSELLGAQLKDVDVARGEIRFPQTKAGRVHTLPLPPFAVRLLSVLPRLLGNP